MRAGHRDSRGRFVSAANCGVLHTHFTDPKYTEQREEESIQAARVAVNLLGDGYIEAIEDGAIIRVARQQSKATRGRISGQVVYVPVLESPSKIAVGRFGWKSQHASLLSAIADTLRTELGISNGLYPPSQGGPAGTAWSDHRLTLDQLATFVRETEYPPRDEALAGSNSAQAGSQVFGRIGCSICHVDTFVTARAGTRLHGGRYTVPERLGGQTIHPYRDFLLHDVGTGDGIVQSATPQYADQSTASKFRTAPLWGVRFRTRMMHDGKAVTYHQAIMRHAGEATEVIEKYQRLPPEQKHQLWEFLNSYDWRQPDTVKVADVSGSVSVV